MATATRPTRQQIADEALSRAVGNQSWSNYAAIIRGFMDRGIPEHEIEPRVNVFTYHAWRALGRQVRKGEHGVKVLTWIVTEGAKQREGESDQQFAKRGSSKRPWTAVVFHVSQTDPINGAIRQ